MIATPRTVTLLQAGKVAISFHVAHEFAELAMNLHKYQDKPMRLELYLEESEHD